MKQHFIYLTTNLVNNKKYIGKHYGEIDDDYIGSGTLLKKAIDKYGKENFNRIILHISKDGQDNNFWEKHYIREYNAVKSDEFYNISEGGDGGDIFH